MACIYFCGAVQIWNICSSECAYTLEGVGQSDHSYVTSMYWV